MRWHAGSEWYESRKDASSITRRQYYAVLYHTPVCRIHMMCCRTVFFAVTSSDIIFILKLLTDRDVLPCSTVLYCSPPVRPPFGRRTAGQGSIVSYPEVQLTGYSTKWTDGIKTERRDKDFTSGSMIHCTAPHCTGQQVQYASRSRGESGSGNSVCELGGAVCLLACPTVM